MDRSDIAFLSAAELASAIESKDVSPVDAVEAYLAWISQIELNSLNMRPSGMERTIKLHTEPVNGHAIRVNSPTLMAKPPLDEPKSSESPAPAQASPSGRPICPERPHNIVTHTVTPRVDYPGASRSRLILSSIPVSISLVTSTSASWNTSLLAWSTNRPPVLISLV